MSIHTTPALIITLSILIFLQGCQQPTLEPEPPTIVDVHDGDTVDLSADVITKEINGAAHEMYAYNNIIPGVTLRTTQGSRFTVNFHNNLPHETTIHWHGLRHNIKDDGVPDISQQPVQPGDTYTYTIYTPDEGIFLYHPHVREDLQQDLGLAGNLLVTANEGTPPVNNEELLVLDDILIEHDQIVPYGKEYANFAIMGRFGNIMLVNGQTDYHLTVNKGDIVRFYITNVANARPFNLSFDGAAVKLIGSDLSVYEQESFIDEVLIAPAERYIVDAYFENEGPYTIVHTTPEKTYALGNIHVTDHETDHNYTRAFHTLASNAPLSEDINRFKASFDAPPDYTIDLTIDMGMMEGMIHDDTPTSNDLSTDGKSLVHHIGMEGMTETDHTMIEWEDDMGMMNAQSTSEQVTWILKDRETEQENMNFMMNARVGDIIKIRLFNDPNSMHPMQHPIHLHGQRFLVLNQDGKQNTNFAWKDTVLVPTGSTVDILVDVTNPGQWMFHCHIAEHLTAGMMTSLLAT